MGFKILLALIKCLFICLFASIWNCKVLWSYNQHTCKCSVQNEKRHLEPTFESHRIWSDSLLKNEYVAEFLQFFQKCGGGQVTLSPKFFLPVVGGGEELIFYPCWSSSSISCGKDLSTTQQVTGQILDAWIVFCLHLCLLIPVSNLNLSFFFWFIIIRICSVNT